MEVDYELAWRELQALVLQKRSHGQRDLLVEMARLEVENRVESGSASLPTRRNRNNGHSPTPPRRVAAGA